LIRLALVLGLFLSGCAVINAPAFTATSYVVQGIKFYFSNFVPSEIVVITTGTGETREEAIDNALLSAVQEAIGVLVVSDVTVQDEKILRNIAIMYSEGVVNSYKVIECKGDIRQSCQITATVSPSKLQRKFASNSNTIEVDGNSLYSQHLTSKNAIIQRSKLTEYYFSAIRKHGLEPKIEEVKLIPSTDSNVTIEITFSVGWNKKFKNNLIEFIEKLEQDTGGKKSKEKDSISLSVWNSPNLFGLSWQYYYINPYNADFRKIIAAAISEPILVSIDPIHHCEYIPAPNSNLFMSSFTSGGNIFYLTDPIKIKLRGTLPPEFIKDIKNFSIQMGCNGYPPLEVDWIGGSSFVQPFPKYSLPKQYQTNFKKYTGY
jgi:hypothetical protein